MTDKVVKKKQNLFGKLQTKSHQEIPDPQMFCEYRKDHSIFFNILLALKGT